MVTLDTLEGVINDELTFHYDLANDVLYLRRRGTRDVPAYGEEDEDGLIVLRSVASNEAIGLTIVNWWQRFGSGERPDSIDSIERSIEPWALKIAVSSVN